MAKQQRVRLCVSRRDFLRAGALLAAGGLAARYLPAQKPGQTVGSAAGPLRIALLSDVHFHDVYANFAGGAFPGLSGADGRKATIRTMASQLSSTRLFNENYFALKAALDEVVSRGIKLVVLNGDFSDDGQPVHMRGLKRILDEYATHHQIRFVTTFGNHDPVKPYGQEHGVRDFLGEGGRRQPIISPGLALPSDRRNTEDLAPIKTEDIRVLGYEGLLEYMGEYGPYPQKNDLYWESPFSTYSHSEYSYERAATEARLENRMYRAYGKQNAAKEDAAAIRVPDLSYVVEPVPGVWFLSIDANVFSLVEKINFEDRKAGSNFVPSGNAGWNRLLVEKGYVVDWVVSVVRQAQALGKQLVTFSHYPMLDTNRGAEREIIELMGTDRSGQVRQPTAETSRQLAALGIGLHFGGHLHLNDTAVYQAGDDFLVNVQIPSTAAYVPAFKMLTLHSREQVEIETVVLKDVPGFDALFEHYRMEHAHLVQTKSPSVWNPRILESPDYRVFSQWHLEELTRRRYLPREWPQDLREIMVSLSGASLLTLLALETDVRFDQVQHIAKSELDLLKMISGVGETISQNGVEALVGDWKAAENKVKAQVAKFGCAWEFLSGVTGLVIATDYHRILSAGSLAMPDVAPRKKLYQVADALAASVQVAPDNASATMPVWGQYRRKVIMLMRAVEKLSSGAPDDHFMIDFKTRRLWSIA